MQYFWPLWMLFCLDNFPPACPQPPTSNLPLTLSTAMGRTQFQWEFILKVVKNAFHLWPCHTYLLSVPIRTRVYSRITNGQRTIFCTEFLNIDRVWFLPWLIFHMYLFFALYLPFSKSIVSSFWIYINSGLPGWHNGKESACQCRRHGFDSCVGKIPQRRKWQPISVFLPGKSHGQRSWVGCSAWGCKRVGHDWVTKQRWTLNSALWN